MATQQFKAGSYKGKDGNYYYIGTNRKLDKVDLDRAKKGLGVRTYKGKDGKYRWIGGGLVHPDALKAIRQRQTRRPGATTRPRPVNPLDQQVNSAINAQVTPLQGMLGERDKQYGAEQELADRANQALQSELTTLGDAYNASKAQATAAVGVGQAATEAEAQRANDFLQSIMGGFFTDPGAAAAAQANNQQAALALPTFGNATLAGQLALEQQAGNQSLALQRGATGQQAAEFVRDRLDAKNADTRTIQTQIAAIRAQAPALRRQFQRENQQMSMAQQQLALDRQQLAQNQAQFEANLGLQYDQLAQNDSQFQQGLAAETAGSAGQSAQQSQANIQKARANAGTMVDNLNTLVGQAKGDPAAFAQLKTRFPNLKLGKKREDGAWVLDSKKWNALSESPSTITLMFKAFKDQGLPPVWAFWAAAKYAPYAFPAGSMFDIKRGVWRKWTAQELKQLDKGWKPIHYRYL